jgi:hypothetical protein
MKKCRLVVLVKYGYTHYFQIIVQQINVMKSIDIWGDREFRVHSDYTLSFVTTCLHIENKFEKMNKKYVSGESADKDAFDVLEFIFRKQIQFKTYICRVVENSMGYPNI